MARTLQLEIVSQDGLLYRDEVQGIVLPGKDGYFGILPRHAPMIAEIGLGCLNVRKDDAVSCFAVTGGIFHVRDGKAVVLADTVEQGRAIDVDRAKRAMERARELLKRAKTDNTINVEEAQAALKRAINRLKAAEMKDVDI